MAKPGIGITVVGEDDERSWSRSSEYKSNLDNGERNMLTRGADGRLYRVDPKGAVVVAEEAQNQTSSRVIVRGSADAGASADIFSASADIFSAKM